MRVNGYQGQLYARDMENNCFAAGVDLYPIINENSDILYISRIGINAPPATVVIINEKNIQIGKTGIYEVEDVKITSIRFEEDSPPDAIIDYIAII